MTHKELVKVFEPLVSGENSNLIQRVLFNFDYTKQGEKVTLKQILKALNELSVKQEKEINKYLKLN